MPMHLAAAVAPDAHPWGGPPLDPLDASVPGAMRRTAGRSIRLPRGLPGFPGIKELALCEMPGGRTDLMLLVAAEGEPCFVVLPVDEPGRIYGAEQVATAMSLLGMEPAHARVFVIVTLRRDAGGLAATPNLWAPLLVDMARGRAEQMTLARNRLPARAERQSTPL